MAATAVNNTYFALDLPDIEFTSAEPNAEHTVDIHIGQHTISTGTVTIRDLGSLVQTYTQPANLDDWAERTGMAPVTTYTGLSIEHHNTAGDLADQVSVDKVFHSNQPTSLSPLTDIRFLSRYTRRTISAETPICFAYVNTGVRVEIHLVLSDGSTLSSATVNPTYTGGTDLIMQHKYSLDALASDAQVEADHIVSVEVDLLGSNDALLDRIIFDIDRLPIRQQTVLLYTNCFGSIEAALLRGTDERTQDMDATFASVLGSYRKIRTEMTERHTAHTGHLNEEGYNAMTDLARSPRVMLLDIDTQSWREVTVTDIGYTDRRPRTTVTDLTVTYRLTNRHPNTFRRPSLPVRVFDPTFDRTFN